MYKYDNNNLINEDELRKLISAQLRPHFLFNCITSIMGLCMKDSDEAIDALSDFSEYLRANIDDIKGETRMIPFTMESGYIESYLNLEKMRYKDRLDFDTDFEEDGFAVPMLSVLPFVENAVKHGVSKSETGGHVSVRSFITDDGYVVEITDDGPGFDPDNIPDDGKVHSGFEGVKRRMKICPDAGYTIESGNGNGTRVRVHFPKGGK